MANFTDFSGITYAGKEYQEIYSKDLYSLDLRNYGITMLDGVKSKQKIYKGEIGDVTQLYSCPFTPQGEASLAESYIEPAAIKYNLENCYDAFWPTYLVEQTSISIRGGIPQTFADWFFAKFREKQASEYEEIFWSGDTGRTATTKSYLKVVDGIETQLEANSGVTKISGSAFTVDNILAQVEAVIQSGMSKAAQDEVDIANYKVLMNYADVQLLKMALGKICCPNNQSIFSNYAMGANGSVVIYGFEVIPTMQSRNGIIFTDPRNLVLGFDTFDDHLSWKLIDMRNSTGDNAFRIIGIANIAVGIVWPEGVIYSRP